MDRGPRHGNIPGPDVIVALVVITDHPNWYGPSGDIAPQSKHVHRRQFRLWVYVYPSVVTGVTDIDSLWFR